MLSAVSCLHHLKVTLHAGVTQKNLGVAWGRDYYMQGSRYKAAQD